MLRLTALINGERSERELAGGVYIIGRGAGCHIRLNSPEVSERHAILTVRDGAVIIEDLPPGATHTCGYNRPRPNHTAPA